MPRATDRPQATAPTLACSGCPPERGKLQFTHNGRPLYSDEHEGPGEIKCHNVDLHCGRCCVVTTRGSDAA